METIQPMLPNRFALKGRSDRDLITVSAGFDFFSDDWNIDGLSHIRSTRGYIIEAPFSNNYMNQDSSYILPLTGTRVDPSTSVEVYYNGDKFNFVGYFLPEQQDPLRALQHILPNLKDIKAKYWSAVKLGDCSSSTWISSEPYPIKYGDMIQLRACENAFDFTWNNSSTAEQSRQYIEPEYFSYTEKPDYTPVFIQLDAEDNPAEIGLLVDNSCYGAVVVEPSDSLVLIRGFLEGVPEGDLEFEFYYGEKKSGRANRVRVRNYQVYSLEKQRNESRKIKRSENSSYYLVNLKSEALPEDQTLRPTIQLNPIPVTNASVIQMRLPDDCIVYLQLFDAGGRKVKDLYHGNYAKGNYEKQIDPHETLLPGVYLISGFIGEESFKQKFIIKK
ncbi:MAG: T9SS type A sorting domain-containing protein [Bacteroidales bacterium]|nr:T9SS type A sorting domain-containing protein [Bacteroidales bacterium]